MAHAKIGITALAASLALAACGGGNIPQALRSGAPSQSGTRGTLRVSVPSAKGAAAKRSQYVGYETQSVTLTYTIGSTTYPAQTVNVSASSPNCTTQSSFTLVCTLAFSAVPGKATYTVSAYDAQNATGKLLSTASSSMTIVAGQENQFNVTLDGVVGAFNVGFTTPTNDNGTIPAGTAADVPVTVGAEDADGYLIVGSPQDVASDGTPITSATVTLTGDPTEFTLEQNGTPLTASGNTYTVAAPFTGLSLHYNGGSYGNLALTIGAGSATGQGTLAVEPVVTEFAASSGSIPPGGELTLGPDGNIWFNMCQQGYSGVGKVTASGAITIYPLQNNAVSCGITSAGGKLWVSEGQNCVNTCGIQELDTTGAVVGRFYVYHGGCDPYPGPMTTDTNGNVWYDNNACGVIGYLAAGSPSTEVHYFQGSIGSIIPGADGRVWYVQSDGTGALTLAAINTAGTVQTYTIPQSGSGFTPSMASRPSDKSVWVAHQGGSFDAVAPASGTVSNYTNSFSNAILSAGADGNIYALSGYQGVYQFASIAQDGTITSTALYSTSTIGQSLPDSMVAGPAGSGTFWFIDALNGNIGRITTGA